MQLLGSGFWALLKFDPLFFVVCCTMHQRGDRAKFLSRLTKDEIRGVVGVIQPGGIPELEMLSEIILGYRLLVEGQD